MNASGLAVKLALQYAWGSQFESLGHEFFTNVLYMHIHAYTSIHPHKLVYTQYINEYTEYKIGYSAIWLIIEFCGSSRGISWYIIKYMVEAVHYTIFNMIHTPSEVVSVILGVYT